MPSPETEPIFRAAKEKGIAFILPYAEKDNGTYYNSAIITDSDGRTLGKFRKIHIPGSVNPTGERKPEVLEKRYFTPGDLGFPIFQTAKAKVGALICYDRRFPSLSAVWAWKGRRSSAHPLTHLLWAGPKKRARRSQS